MDKDEEIKQLREAVEVLGRAHYAGAKLRNELVARLGEDGFVGVMETLEPLDPLGAMVDVYANPIAAAAVKGGGE